MKRKAKNKYKMLDGFRSRFFVIESESKPLECEYYRTEYCNKLQKVKKVMKTVLGGRIKERRKQLRMTQEKLAELMCLPKTTVSSYERGTAVKDDRLIQLAQVLKTTPNWLLGFEEDNSFVTEMCSLLSTITDEQIQKILLAEVKALCE